jgi:hypothetical protein
VNHTEQLIEEALHHPELAPPGGCLYVNNAGCRCIAGTVLHLAGVSDDILKGRDWNVDGTHRNSGDDPNELSFTKDARNDLVQEAEIRYLDTEAIRDAQREWDGNEIFDDEVSIRLRYNQIQGTE